VDRAYGDRQKAFRGGLADSGLTTVTFTTADGLETRVLHALTELPRARTPGVPDGPSMEYSSAVGGVHRSRGAVVRLAGSVVLGGRAVVQAVHGMGGVGKTTAAMEYAHRYGDDYDVAWWVPAKDPTLVPDRLAELAQALSLARALSLATVPEGAEVALARLLGALRERQRWLLVFDNAEDPSALGRFPLGRARPRDHHLAEPARTIPATATSTPRDCKGAAARAQPMRPSSKADHGGLGTFGHIGAGPVGWFGIPGSPRAMALGQCRRCRGADLRVLSTRTPKIGCPPPACRATLYLLITAGARHAGPTVREQRRRRGGHGCLWCAAQCDLILSPSGRLIFCFWVASPKEPFRCHSTTGCPYGAAASMNPAPVIIDATSMMTNRQRCPAPRSPMTILSTRIGGRPGTWDSTARHLTRIGWLPTSPRSIPTSVCSRPAKKPTYI
jgi:hypothetical protein